MKLNLNNPVTIPAEKLKPFDGHPYKVQDNEEMNNLIESIREQGILSPLIVRPLENTADEYEVISGHRRLHAAMKAGLETVPAFIYDICSVHYIRNVVLEQIVLESISNLSDFVSCYQSVFLFLAKMKQNETLNADVNNMKIEIERNQKRIFEIDKAIGKLFESNMANVISDERFMKMTADYEAEQKELKEDIEKKTNLLESSEQKKVDMRMMLLKGLRAFSECKTLTPEILNMLIERIEVHKSEKIDGKKRVKVDVYFTAIGMIDIPTEAEIETLTEEIRNNSDKMRLIA